MSHEIGVDFPSHAAAYRVAVAIAENANGVCIPGSASQDAQRLDPDDATRCDGCGAPMWLGLDVLRRSQEGEDFRCDACTEEAAR